MSDPDQAFESAIPASARPATAMSSGKHEITTIPISSSSSAEKRSEETLRPDLNALISSEKCSRIESKAIETLPLAAPSTRQPPLPPPSPRQSGILRHERVSLSHSSASHVSRQVLINGIPLTGIMFLDLANSGDFPANVFNETNPVPTFAIILMSIGATFALVMSGVAFWDANRSWKAIQLLRQEQKELRAKAAAKEKALDTNTDGKANHIDTDPTLDSFLHLNRRDLGTEFFERFGMEVFMGGASFMIAVGTYMAIGGDNKQVFMASNLLSGYIGNTPAAFYGLINAGWSVIISFRARRQRKAAIALDGSVHARGALIRRARMIQTHSAFSGLSCLISGALGMLTPTYWEPYPALLVFGLLFMYTLYLFRKRISYIRAPLTLHAADITTADLVHEIDELLSLQEKIMATKSKSAEKTHIIHDRHSLEQQLQKISLCGLFEKFCVELVLMTTSSPCTQLAGLIKERQLAELTPEEILKLADEVYTISETEGDDVTHESIYQALGHWCEGLLRRKTVLRRISMRSRFLLELLGSHMITFPGGRSVYQSA